MEQKDKALLTQAFQFLESNKYDDFLMLLPTLKAQINEPDPTGETLMIKEIRKKFPNVAVVEQIMALSELNLEVRDTKFKMTPALHAFSTQNEALWRLFATNLRVNMNATDSSGDTMLTRELTYSSYPNQTKLGIILDREDVDIDKRNGNGLSALDIAIKQEQEKGPKYYQAVPLLKAAQRRFEKRRLDREAQQRNQLIEDSLERRLRPLERQIKRLTQANKLLHQALKAAKNKSKQNN